jgi:hypothetical protein
MVPSVRSLEEWNSTPGPGNPNAMPRMRRVPFGALLLAGFTLVAFPKFASAHRAPPSCCASAATPPLVIPAWGYGGDPEDTDPGPIPDRHLFAAILDNNQTTSPRLAANCPGVSRISTCQPYKYVDFLYNFCSTPITLAAYRYADARDETAFLHVYPRAPTPADRITWLASPNPNGPACTPRNPQSVMRMNPGDRALNAWLRAMVWNASDRANGFPAPYGVMEDDANLLAGVAVGTDGGEISTEYGGGLSPTGFANAVGDSPYHAAVDWETALGIFVGGACSARCLNVTLNGIASGYGNITACSVISAGHCHSHYFAGVIDDQVAIDNVCRAAAGGNLKYLLAERPIFSGRNGRGFMDSQSMTVEINTVAGLYAHVTGGCAQTKILDLEPGYGDRGRGDVNGGTAVRTATLAFRWLIANPATGMPDRVLPFIYTIGGTTGEVPYYFEETLVPAGAEHPVGTFNWNGTTQTVGGGCPSSSGDTGGAISLLVQCAGSAGIYCQQYRRLFVNGTDYGKAAACLNTSTTREVIAASWFTGDPIGSYRYRLALQGGEMTSVRYKNAYGGTIPLTTCTNSAYCTGTNTLSAQVAAFKGAGSDTLCGPCGVILLQKR